MEKPCKMTMRQYVGLVRDLNARIQMSPIFHENQQLDEYELVDSLANKAPRSHKAMLIYQGFNPETGDLETFVEHCERAETMDNIAGAKFSASDEDGDTKKKKSASSSKDKTSMVRNARKTIPSCIALYMVKTPATPPGSAKSPRRKARTSLSIPQRIKRGSPGK